MITGRIKKNCYDNKSRSKSERKTLLNFDGVKIEMFRESRQITARARYITQQQPAWERTSGLCSATRQTIAHGPFTTRKPLLCASNKSAYIHQACLYLRWSQSMQQYSNLAWTDTRSHGDTFPTLPLPTALIGRFLRDAAPVVSNQFLLREKSCLTNS